MAKRGITTLNKFLREHVTVKIPPQARAVQVIRLPVPPLGTMPASPGGFRPFRPVINLRYVDAAHPQIEVLVFDPPIEVRVRYTEDDLASAQNQGGSLSLGFWNGKQWIRFTPEKHNFHLVPSKPPGNGGWGVVRISHWGDPPKAWGT